MYTAIGSMAARKIGLKCFHTVSIIDRKVTNILVDLQPKKKDFVIDGTIEAERERENGTINDMNGCL